MVYSTVAVTIAAVVGRAVVVVVVPAVGVAAAVGEESTEIATPCATSCLQASRAADGFRTRAARVIRRRVLGVLATKVETERGERDGRVIPGRMGPQEPGHRRQKPGSA